MLRMYNNIIAHAHHVLNKAQVYRRIVSIPNTRCGWFDAT